MNDIFLLQKYVQNETNRYDLKGLLEIMIHENNKINTETNKCMVDILIHEDKKQMYGRSNICNANSKRCETTSDVSGIQSWRNRLVEKTQTSQYTT